MRHVPLEQDANDLANGSTSSFATEGVAVAKRSRIDGDGAAVAASVLPQEGAAVGMVRKAGRAPRGSSRMPTSEHGLEHETLTSVTVTPSKKRCNVPLSEPVQLQNVQALLRAISDACETAQVHGMRLLPGVVARYIIGIEAGKKRGNYHLQGILVMKTIERNPEMVVYAVTEFLQAAIKGLALNVRITKLVKPGVFADELFMVGYVQKDVGLRHHSQRQAGYGPELLERAVRVYRSKAGSNTYSSDKINLRPEKDNRSVPLNTANLLATARWFLQKEGLRVLLPVSSIAKRVSWMLETDNYYIDIKVISGDKGTPLDEARFEALNLLLDDPRAREDLSIIRCVLFGPSGMEPSTDTDRVFNRMPSVAGLPTRLQVDGMSLHQAKVFAVRFNTVGTQGLQAPGAELGLTGGPSSCRTFGHPPELPPALPMMPSPVDAPMGVAVVVDLASSLASGQAAALLRSGGFSVHMVVGSNQYPNACGHLAEMSAVMLQAAGNRFHELRLEQLASVNTYGCIALQERKLGRSLAQNAMPPMLTDDEILRLATLDNPNGQGTAPAWMPGPAPFNSFRNALRESIGAPSDQVQIMIVNTIEVDTLDALFVGEHWFTIAWQRDASAANS
jgi:hypothetical protein